MSGERVHVLAGNSFAVSDAEGDMECDRRTPTGLFSFDTRFLSRWVLTIDGKRCNTLSREDMTHFETRFLLVPGAASHYVDADVSVLRHRSLDQSFNERITVLNHSAEPATFAVRLEIGSDFADTGEIAAPKRRRVQVTARPEQRELRLRYARERFSRETVVTSTRPVEVDEAGMTFRIVVEPHGSWVTDLHVRMLLGPGVGQDLRTDLESHRRKLHEDMRTDLCEFLDRAPELVAESGTLGTAYRRSLLDLAALRYNPLAYTEPLPVAGMPWSMSLYGRDALVTAFQTLPYVPGLASSVLRMLALDQGSRLDDQYDEEPGKILAGVRYGERSAFGEDPTTIYYGAADTTPLFVILLDEYERWYGDADLVRELRHPARMALDWIDEYGDSLGDGYVRYQRRNTRDGLVNQCWKNSDDAIVGRDGRAPGFPRATCELQGYAYDAKLRGARLAREFWNDPAYADRLEREAAGLRERFDRDFWLPHRGAYALALGPDGEPVDAIASNQGHLLWSGIVDARRADEVAAHLLGPELFSGWGVRTLGSAQHGYNPVGAHLGAVWPFDTVLAAAGLRRYGFHREAARIAQGVVDMAGHFAGRLPELVAGYDRSLTRYPVPLPAGGSPQAWSAGALLMILSTILGLAPCGGNLLVNPELPEGFGRIELLDIPGRWGHADAYGRDRAAGRNGRPR
ncbi:Glycogen debranching enzyme (alpha-1,6-glucosidase) [Micromonospora pallida]|uniref:Glycogen debranching enzyme (Alpha-1,6-glucosidase) n=1 Tax=Micromonospora pallida TaxID=145854 RepID=A0A1C6SS98_9ACTN|nr:glycogen debranching N-terminal domain-containing protein [Micromonospora pallida]SCL32340.1 Glycogen debranching enzyme (alpha-1,6-glucosidase) [Micromonospora pallida]